MQRVLFLLVLLCLMGCASEAKFKQNVHSWLGLTENQLTAAWGIPTRVYENGNRKLLEYASNKNVYMPGTQTYNTNYYGNTAYTNVYNNPGYNIPLNCVVTFQVVNGIIEAYNYRGNNCVAE